MAVMITRIEICSGVALELDERASAALRQQLRDGGGTSEGTVRIHEVSGPETLTDDHPMWERHAGGMGHSSPPEWKADDGELAMAFYASVGGKAKVFLDLLIDRPGQLLTTDAICGLAPATFASDRAIAGSLNGLRKPKDQSRRRYPFYWWDGTPTRYAIKPSVAALFREARTRLSM